MWIVLDISINMEMYAGSILGHDNRSYRNFNKKSLFLEVLFREIRRKIQPALSWREVSGHWSKSQLLRSGSQNTAWLRSTNLMSIIIGAPMIVFS